MLSGRPLNGATLEEELHPYNPADPFLSLVSITMCGEGFILTFWLPYCLSLQSLDIPVPPLSRAFDMGIAKLDCSPAGKQLLIALLSSAVLANGKQQGTG